MARVLIHLRCWLHVPVEDLAGDGLTCGQDVAQGVGGVKSRPVLRPETEDLLHIVVAASLASQDMDRLGSVTGILSFSLLTRILTLVTDRALVGARSNLDPSQPGGDSGTAREGRGLGVLLQGSTEEIRGCFARLDLLSRFL